MMKNIKFTLKSEPSKTFLAQKAANSLDIDVNKKLSHNVNLNADIDTNYNVGLVYGASGSGKTTLVTHLFGEDCFVSLLDTSKTLIDQFPDDWSYDDIASILNGVGLSSVTCWLRPAVTLSNGQRFRAEVALQMANERKLIVIDEWTSVVDRTVAKAMSNSIQKFARKKNIKIVLCSCHEDVFEWLNPCWVIDCNKQEYTDRRLLWQSYIKKEKIKFDIRKCDRKTWKQFSKYHYLSENLAGGHIETFGVFIDEKQVGFQCFANYVPHRKGTIRIMHSNRTVIHPDYVGFGLGIDVINITSAYMKSKGYRVAAKFSSIPVYKAFLKHKDKWKMKDKSKNLKKIKAGGNMDRKDGFRDFVKTYSFEWIGGSVVENIDRTIK